MRRVSALLLASSFAFAQAQQQSDADKLFGAAMQAQQKGDMPTAIRDYQKLLQLEPKLTDARVNLGAALAHAGRYDEAIAQYRLALEAMPQNPQIRMNLGLAFYKKGDLPDAIHEFDQVHQQEPGNVQLAILLADSDIRSGKGPDALAVLQPLDAANAGNPDFEYVLGTALVASGHRREGVDRLQHLADTTHSADAYFLAGSTLLDLKSSEAAHKNLNSEEARKDLDIAFQMNPKLPRVATLAGIARDRCNDPVQAEQAFRAALQEDLNDFDANLYLGTMLLKRRNMDEAKPYLDRALQLNTTSNMARYESALWQSTAGQYASAVSTLEAIVKDDPDWLDPHIQLATVYYRVHRPEDGAKERAIVARITAEQANHAPGK